MLISGFHPGPTEDEKEGQARNAYIDKRRVNIIKYDID